MVTIVDNITGKVYRAQFDDSNLRSNEIAITELQTELLVNPYFNFETRTFYEGATEEEITEANKPIVPQEVSRLRFLLVLFNLGITEDIIYSFIENIEDTTQKELAKLQFKNCLSFERENELLKSMAVPFGISEEQLDNIFIQAEQIVI